MGNRLSVSSFLLKKLTASLWLLLIGGVSLANAQGGGRVPPSKIVLTNAAPVPDSWELFEAELYFGHCHDKIRVPQSEEVTYDGGPRRENPANLGFWSFDG